MNKLIRVWDSHKNEWIDDFCFLPNGEILGMDKRMNVIFLISIGADRRYLKCWRTGKQDGQQNDLYTGDIVTSTEYPFQDDGVYNYHGIVEWCDERAAFVIRKVLVNSKKSGDLDGASDYLAEHDLETFEKLGNVYEHGDLLEKV